MKTVIPSLLALLSCMVDNTNALQLETELSTQLKEEECPHWEQTAELFNQFSAFSKGNERITYAQYADLLENFRLDPPNHQCSGLDDGDFYKTYMSSACTGNEPNYSIPEIVRCDGFIQFCADSGKLRHFVNVSPDGSGKEHESLSGRQFQQAIDSLNKDLTLDLPLDKKCLVYEIITDPGLISNGISQIIYEYVQVFGDTGNGGKGWQEQEVKVVEGRSSQEDISHKVKVTAEANQNWVNSAGIGSAKGTISYDFAGAFQQTGKLEVTTKTTLHLDFGVPNYIYNQKVTIRHNDGRFVTIYGGVFISHREGGEAFRRVVQLDDKGKIIDETLTACTVCPEDQVEKQ